MNVYTWGSGSSGCLGHGNSEDLASPRRVADLTFDISSPLLAAGGGSHALIVSSNQLATAGSNEEGQLGIGDRKERSRFVLSSTLPCPIHAIAASWTSSVAIAGNDHKLYQCGELYSQSSRKENAKSSFDTWQLHSLDWKFSQVACGLNHFAAVTDKGSLFMWGGGRHGQLGISDSIVTVPTLIPVGNNEKVIKVALGIRHSVCLVESGKVFVAGCNKFGQCGADPKTHPAFRQFTHIAHLDGFYSTVACGWNHTILLECSGSLVTFGRNNYCQLGVGRGCGTENYLPQRPQLHGRVVSLSCGSEHTVAVIRKERDARQTAIFTWGWNEHGQLGHGDEHDREFPEEVSELSTVGVETVACGNGFCMAFAAAQSE